MPSVAVDRVLGALRAQGCDPKRRGRGWRARCPAHADTRPSLDVDEGREGDALVTCRSQGCPAEAIVAALGLQMGDLFAGPASNGGRWSQADADPALARRGLRRETIDRFGIVPDLGKQAWRFAVGTGTRYKRFTPGEPKMWWQGSKPKEGADVYGLDIVDPESHWLLLVEGEPDVWIGHQAGLPAVSLTGGATAVPRGGIELLAEDGRPVTVLYDADDAGRAGAAKVADALRTAGAEVFVRRYVDLPPGGDLTDLYGALDRDDAALRERVATLPIDPEEAGDAEADSDPAVYRTLTELLTRPELLKPPECVLARIAYRGRGVLFCGPDKSGKSTFLAHAATALTLGRSWLGESTARGRVVWCGLEEALGDAVRRFHELGADPDRIQMLTLAPNDLLTRTDALLTGWPADLLVIDSLHEYARVTYGETPGDGDNALWGAITRPVVALARKHAIALDFLHHVRRSDGQGRGASEIFASVDATLTLYMPTTADDPTSRRIEGRGRWPIERFRIRLRDGCYELATGTELSLDALVLIHVEQNPGASKNQIRQAVQGRNSVIDAAIHQLVERGAIENRGTDRMPRYHTPSEQTEASL